MIRFVSFFQEDSFTDPEWAAVNHQAWTIAEPSFYLIASTLPLLRPVGLSVWNKASQVIRHSRSTGSMNTADNLTWEREGSITTAEGRAASSEEKQNAQRDDGITRTDEIIVAREVI